MIAGGYSYNDLGEKVRGQADTRNGVVKREVNYI